jgi:putative flippase GtrA
MIAGLFRRGPRYALVGLFCAVLSNVIMIAVDGISGHSLIAVTASVAVLIPTGFILQALVTFEQPPSWRAFGRYAALMVWNWPLFSLCVWLIHDELSVPMVWAAPVTTILSFLWNYAASAWAIAWPPRAVAIEGD